MRNLQLGRAHAVLVALLSIVSHQAAPSVARAVPGCDDERECAWSQDCACCNGLGWVGCPYPGGPCRNNNDCSARMGSDYSCDFNGTYPSQCVYRPVCNVTHRLVSATQVLPDAVEIRWSGPTSLPVIEAMVPSSGTWHVPASDWIRQQTPTSAIVLVPQSGNRIGWVRDRSAIYAQDPMGWRFRLRGTDTRCGSESPVVDIVQLDEVVRGDPSGSGFNRVWGGLFEERSALVTDTSAQVSVSDTGINRAIVDAFYDPMNLAKTRLHRELGQSAGYRVQVQYRSHRRISSTELFYSVRLWVSVSAMATGVFNASYTGELELLLRAAEVPIAGGGTSLQFEADLDAFDIFSVEGNATLQIPAEAAGLLKAVLAAVLPETPVDRIHTLNIDESGSIRIDSADAWIEPPQFDFDLGTTAISTAVNGLVTYTVTRNGVSDEHEITLRVPVELRANPRVLGQELVVDLQSLRIGDTILRVPHWLDELWRELTCSPGATCRGLSTVTVVEDTSTLPWRRGDEGTLYYLNVTPAAFRTDGRFFTADLRILQLGHPTRARFGAWYPGTTPRCYHHANVGHKFSTLITENGRFMESYPMEALTPGTWYPSAGGRPDGVGVLQTIGENTTGYYQAVSSPIQEYCGCTTWFDNGHYLWVAGRPCGRADLPSIGDL